MTHQTRWTAHAGTVGAGGTTGEGPAGSGPENAYKCVPVAYVIAFEDSDHPGMLYGLAWPDLASARSYAEPGERIWGLVPVEGALATLARDAAPAPLWADSPDLAEDAE